MAGQSTDASHIRRLEREARKRLAGRLDAIRVKHEYSLNFLADAAQIGRGHLSNIFAGRSNVTLTTLVKLAYALGVDPAELLAPGPVDAPSFSRGRPRTRRTRRISK